MLVLGDAHANVPERRRALFAAYRAAGQELALQAGDLMFYDLPTPTYFIAGNNEVFDVIAALRFGLLERSDVHNAHLLHSTAVDVAGLRVAGLSGNFAPSRYNRPRESLTGDRRRHFTADDVARAKTLGGVDVFLAHEAPNGLPVSESYDVGCGYIDEILDALDPDLCLVGHHHEHAETTLGDTSVVSLAPAWESYYVLDRETLAVERYETPPA
ncbi:MAG TPA: metallophosphoesterase [Halobacteriales archaeon]|nr:metallophosphoesterase [Halobacteriales archaeon]